MSLMNEVQIKGDGNCLYRCFSYLAFNRDQEKHSIIRQQIVNFVQSHKEENLFRDRWIEDGSLEKWCDKQERDCEYGDEVSISAFNYLYYIPVVVRYFDIEGNENIGMLNVFNQNNYDLKDIKPWVLVYRCNHYNLIDDRQ